ncbi:sensor domain-containing diguanylate cyclase [Glaciecola petra]|uniref:diguanylate cyclase n=1 Tax=Glaciecola petra TaxID=3075602 RepID=A0ABU2ZLB8_9ALTE|nr:diguanylate cyclase [Aestuariibacter sp. P117]MDT0593417.1 diguanylate cyclase [Aestuariibacter sp. P117]
MSILVTVFTLLSADQQASEVPKVSEGKLDLTGTDITQRQPIKLSGSWDFYWQKLLTFDELGLQEDTPTQVEFPGIWRGKNHQGKTLDHNGFATYVVEVSLPKNYEHLAIRVPNIGSAYRLYVNENLIASGGQVANNAERHVSKYSPGTYAFKPDGQVFKLLLQISNYDYYWGGSWNALELGTHDQLQEKLVRETLKTSFIVAIFFTISLFNLLLFSLRIRNILPLIIAMISIGFGIREAEINNLLHYVNIFDSNFLINIRTNFLSFTGLAPLLIMYFYLSFKNVYNKIAIYMIVAITVGFSLFIGLAPIHVFSNKLPYFQFLIMGIIVYLIFGLIKAIYLKKRNAGTLFIGSLILACLSIHDIFLSLGWINTVPLVSLGLVAFVMCQNYITYADFILASTNNKKLNRVLEQQNNELQQFSNSLEKQVEERTEELENLNRKLELLANEDALTSAYNRRGISVFLEQAKAVQKRSGTPFCIALIDFDNFKTVNDSLGHDVGDLTLKKACELIQAIIREQDKFGRWGGEEFVLLATDTNLQGAAFIAEKLRCEIEEKLAELIAYKVTVTIGVAECGIEENIESCLKRSDNALYKGKMEGRNQVALSKN